MYKSFVSRALHAFTVACRPSNACYSFLDIAASSAMVRFRALCCRAPRPKSDCASRRKTLVIVIIDTTHPSVRDDIILLSVPTRRHRLTIIFALTRNDTRFVFVLFLLFYLTYNISCVYYRYINIHYITILSIATRLS